MLLEFLGRLNGELPQGCFRQLGSGTTIVARVGRRWRETTLQPPSHDSSHRRPTRRFLAVAEHLAEKGPDDGRRRIDRVDSEQIIVTGEDASDAFGRKHGGKRQAVARQKGVDNSLKSAIAASATTCYAAHDKPSLALNGNQAKEGSKKIAKGGLQSKSSSRLPAKYLKPPARVKADSAPRTIIQHPTVPFVSGTFLLDTAGGTGKTDPTCVPLALPVHWAS